MRAKIERMTRTGSGASVGIINTERGDVYLYGLPAGAGRKDAIVEYQLVTSRTGSIYAKFLGYARAMEDETENVAEDSGALGLKMTRRRSGEDSANCMTVSELNALIKRKISLTPEFDNFWVKGEVTNYSGHKRHYYFDLKDGNCLIRCVLWDSKAASVLKFTLEKGQQVAVRGTFEFYDKNGSCHVNVSNILNLGEGDAKLKLQMLKEKLTAEGIFDVEHHKEVPKFAKRVGVVTSKDGQAIRDICKVWRERNPYVQVILYDVNVQGEHAVRTTIEGIRYLDQANVDVIIVGRGGGSDEELMVYDDEMLVRAVYEAKTPIVSAVGHQGHNPLVDLAADARFATPTDAAQHVISDVMSEIKRVDDLKHQIDEKIQRKVEEKQLKIQKLRAELEKNSPATRLEERRNRLKIADERMRSRMVQIFGEKNHRFEVLLARLNGLSPTAKLVRGFGYISLNEKPVASIEEVEMGDELSVRIHDGEIRAKVTELKKEKIEA